MESCTRRRRSGAGTENQAQAGGRAPAAAQRETRTHAPTHARTVEAAASWNREERRGATQLGRAGKKPQVCRSSPLLLHLLFSLFSINHLFIFVPSRFFRLAAPERTRRGRRQKMRRFVAEQSGETPADVREQRFCGCVTPSRRLFYSRVSKCARAREKKRGVYRVVEHALHPSDSLTGARGVRSRAPRTATHTPVSIIDRPGSVFGSVLIICWLTVRTRV